jgi:hypothetical protein
MRSPTINYCAVLGVWFSSAGARVCYLALLFEYSNVIQYSYSEYLSYSTVLYYKY